MTKHNRPRFTKISVRLSFSYGLLFFLTIIVLNVIILISIHSYIQQTATSQIENLLSTLTSEIQTTSDITTFDFLELSRTNENMDIIVLQGDTILVNTNSQYTPFEDTSSSVVRIESGENTVMYLTDFLTLQDAQTIQVQVIKNIDNEVDYYNALLIRLIILDGFVILASVLVGFYISQKALSPIDSMSKQAREISTSNLGQRIQINGPEDELSRLANTFNELISRLSKAYIMQNEFALNASHELSTPLSVVQGYVDLLDRWGKENPEVLEEAISSIQNELKHMNGLLDTLFMLSKTDNELIPIEKQDFPLNELVQQIVKEYTLIYANTPFVFQGGDHLWLNADPKLISQMIRAILDNAIKFNQGNSPIEMLLGENTNQITIQIRDHGIGIGREDLEHIFERFYRVDKARSKSIGGTGLGLSFVQWIVEMHHGKIDVQSTLHQGTTVTINLPKIH